MILAQHLAARVPRYTSYPTAPHFDAAVTHVTFERWLEALPATEPASLYIHIPFCDSLCWFCGCQTTVINRYAPVSAYVATLLLEISRVARLVGPRRRVRHIHFGGGSPTILASDDIGRIFGLIRDSFTVLAKTEIAIEVDPRGLTQETVEALARGGVNRASLGVQDVNPVVQRAVNRWQPMSVTRDAAARLRDAGVAALNVDLMYGLPHQRLVDVERTTDETVTLAPQRIAFFGYAHVPEMKRHQRLIDAASLPDLDERLRQCETGARRLSTFGYQSIGLDHFALPEDALAHAQRNGTLRRNFQGYTSDTANALIGFGASAISCLPQGYAQNASTVAAYRSKLAQGGLATARGRALTGDDRLRRAVIERLMCDLSADLQRIAGQYDRRPAEFEAEMRALSALEQEGLVNVDGYRVTVPNSKRAAVRLIASVFDTYLQESVARHSAAV